MATTNYTKFGKYFKDFSKFYNKRPEFKAFLEIILSTFAVLIFSIFAIKPTLTTVAQLQKDVRTKTEILEQMDTKLNNLNTTRLFYEQEKDKINKLNTAIPNNPNPQDFARQIEGLVIRHSVQLVGVSIEKITLIGDTSQVNSDSRSPLPDNTEGMAFGVNYISNYQTIQNFLSDLENLRIPIVIDEVSIRLNNNGQVVTSIKGRAPYFSKNK